MQNHLSFPKAKLNVHNVSIGKAKLNVHNMVFQAVRTRFPLRIVAGMTDKNGEFCNYLEI
jgi:hypothetical protein